MLQWMGGSRQKVTSSRKSTHNRQKHYFEERKRQQHVPGLENYTDVRNKRPHYHEEHRSLDILSLINLATVAQQGYSSNTNELGVSQVDSHFSKLSPEIVLKKVTCRYSKDLEKPRSEPGFISPNKLSATTGPQSVPASHGSSSKLDKWKMQASPCEYTSNNIDYKLSELKEEAQNEVSVLDLLGDDGPKSISEGRSVPEAHVAFSFEGLGKVGIGTPARSPRLHNRDLRSPPKASTWIRSSGKLKPSQYDLGLKLNSMMHDIRVAQDGSPLESICNTRGILDSEFSNMKSTMFSMSADAYENQNKKFNNDEEESFYTKGQREQHWNTAFGIFDDNFLNEKKHGSAWKNKPLHTESYPSFTSKAKKYDTSDYDFRDPFTQCSKPLHTESYPSFTSKAKKYDTSDYDLGDPFSQCSRTLFREDKRSDISAPSAPYFRHLTSEKEYNLVPFDPKRCHSLNEKSNSDSMFSLPAWSFLATEDSQNSMSLLSEESCSSAAVKLKQSKSKYKDLHQKHSRKEYDLGKFSADETTYAGLDEVLLEKNVVGAGNYKIMINQWNSKADHCSKSYSALQENLEPECISVCKEKYTSATVPSAPSSCHRTFMETDTRSFSHKLMSEDDLFNLFPVPKLYPTAELTHGESKSNVLINNELPNNFIYENEILEQLLGPVQLWKAATFPLESEGHFPYSSCAREFQTDTQFPGLSKQQNIDEDSEDECRNAFEKPQNRDSAEKNSLSSNGRTASVADCKKSCSDNVELKDKTRELFDGPKTRDPSDEAEEVPRAMEEVTSLLESCIDDKLNHFDSRSAVPFQVSKKDFVKEKSEPERKNVGSKGGSNRDASYQVMLESYVLQLLCVQKVLLEASEKDVKK